SGVTSDLLFHPAFDRLQRAGQCRRIGAARLRHVRPAAALAAHLLRDEVHQLARLHLGGEVGGDAGDERDLAVVHGAEHDRRRLEAILELIERLAQRLGVRALHRGGQHLRPLTVTACEARSTPCPEASFSLSFASSFSSVFFSSIRLLTAFSTMPAPACARTCRATSWNSCSCLSTSASALVPVVASMRRTPEATPPSDVTLNRPMSPVRATCVPPQNSRDEPMSSTRTSSPYFSPNSITAPERFASSIGMTWARVGTFCRISALTSCSTRW